MAFCAQLAQRCCLLRLQASYLFQTASVLLLTLWLIVKRVPFVDHIIVLDKHGYITEQGSFAALDSAGGYISTFSLGHVDTDIKMGQNDKMEKPNMQLLMNDKDSEAESHDYRGNGDISVYLYYIRSIGWMSSLFFAVAIAGFIFCISFPSKLGLESQFSPYTNTIWPAIWVKWWASSNEANPGKRTGYYLGIYAMLGVVAMLSLVAGAWFVLLISSCQHTLWLTLCNLQANDHKNGT